MISGVSVKGMKVKKKQSSMKLELPAKHWIWEFVKKGVGNKMHKINDKGEIVDKDGVPILDHKGRIIVVPLEYRYHYRHYLEDD